MPRILLIDDDRIIRKLVENSLTSLGYTVTTAESGAEGLKIVKDVNPDIIVTDKMMPGIDGFEVTRRLRREPKFANTPIIVLTGESDLEDKLGAFEAGADDYLSKPFEQKELAARITALLRRSEALKAAQNQIEENKNKAHIIAVHTLRGGIGSSSIAVNLAMALQNLWNMPTLLADLVMGTGQLALMLNKTLTTSWANLESIPPEELDLPSVAKIISKHPSNLHFIGAPNDPIIAERVSGETINAAISLIRPRYQYIVADLPHNFSNATLELLDIADQIFLVLAPDMASIRAASTALNVYKELGYDPEKIKIVLNNTFEFGAIPTKKIVTALKHGVILELPYAPKQFLNGINRGTTIIESDPEGKISTQFELLAFSNSQETHQSIPPANPSLTWHRVNSHLNLFETPAAKKKQKSRTRLLFSTG
ncbi:MAG: response regulator [Chloroflexota bacterium]